MDTISTNRVKAYFDEKEKEYNHCKQNHSLAHFMIDDFDIFKRNFTQNYDKFMLEYCKLFLNNSNHTTPDIFLCELDPSDKANTIAYMDFKDKLRKNYTVKEMVMPSTGSNIECYKIEIKPYKPDTRIIGKFKVTHHKDSHFSFEKIDEPEKEVSCISRGGTDYQWHKDAIINAHDPISGEYISFWSEFGNQRLFMSPTTQTHPCITGTSFVSLYMTFGVPCDAAFIDGYLYILTDIDGPPKSLHTSLGGGSWVYNSNDDFLGRYILKYKRVGNELEYLGKTPAQDAVALDGNGNGSTDPWARFALPEKN